MSNMSMDKKTIRKKAAYLLDVGEEFEPLEFVVTPELNQQYLYAEEDFHPRYIEGGEEGSPLVHPGLLFNMSNNTRSPSFYLPPGWAEVHVAEETEFLNPARVNKKNLVTWKVVKVFKNLGGKPWHILDILIVDEDGRQIMRRKMTNTFVSRTQENQKNKE
jgi:hypothetical protein